MELKNLEKIVGAQGIVTDPGQLASWSVDGLTPQAMVAPADLKQAAAVIKEANRQGFKLALAGGGTMSSIGGLLTGATVVLSTKRLDKIIDMDPSNLTVTAQGGVVHGDLQDLLTGLENRCFFPVDSELQETADYMCSSREYKGAFIPVDPPLARKATMGGMVAANTTGPFSLLYRPLRDLVLGVRFVSPTGEIIGMGGKTVKNVSGYDVSKLMIGSYGCLGLVGEMTIRLLPLPEEKASLVVIFDQAAKAKDMVRTVLDSKLIPTALEALNATALGLAASDLPQPPAGGLAVVVALEGLAEDVKRQVKDLKEMAAKCGASQAVELQAQAGSELWTALADKPLMGAEVKFKASYLFGGYPVFMDLAASAGGDCAFRVSAGLAQSHIFMLADGVAAAAAGAKYRQAALDLKGALVVEKASPQFKGDFDVWGPPRSDFVVAKRIKQELDPQGVMNPGRMVGGL